MPKRNKSCWAHIEELIPDEKYRIWWKVDRKPNGKRYQLSRVIYGTQEDAETELAKFFIQRGEGLPDMIYEELQGVASSPSLTSTTSQCAPVKTTSAFGRGS